MNTKAVNTANINKRQADILKAESRGTWYYERFWRMSLIENRKAGKKMKKHERAE
tara:strand:+ start:341 stop:505 length:165 start_codon:yes stop_codon:yes gene_type:complete